MWVQQIHFSCLVQTPDTIFCSVHVCLFQWAREQGAWFLSVWMSIVRSVLVGSGGWIVECVMIIFSNINREARPGCRVCVFVDANDVVPAVSYGPEGKETQTQSSLHVCMCVRVQVKPTVMTTCECLGRGRLFADWCVYCLDWVSQSSSDHCTSIY